MSVSLPLTILLLGVGLTGRAAPLPPLAVIDMAEPMMHCPSMSYAFENHTKHTAFNLGDIMKWLNPDIGISCDASSGMMAPGATEDASFLHREQNFWRLYRA